MHHAGPGVLLASQILELRNARELKLVRVIHYGDGLKPFLVERGMFKLERTVRKLAVAKVEVIVDRPGVDKLSILNLFFNVAIIRVKNDVDL